MMKNKWMLMFLTVIILLLSTAAGAQDLPSDQLFSFRFASEEEGRELLMENTEYYGGFSPNDLQFRLQDKNAGMEEYLAFAAAQVRDFTDDETAFISEYMGRIKDKIISCGYVIPPLDMIIFVKTTMAEECGAAAYTHGTHIFISGPVLEFYTKSYQAGINIPFMEELLAHELFHCLTRCDPDFREKMYGIIRFTVAENDFPIPPSVFEYQISNPDVEHHNSYASFIIDGKPVDCFTVFVTKKHFENPGDRFFDFSTTALVPIDGTDTYFTPEQASNFYEIFGRNTNYVIDPEECLADNFSYALVYGTEGPAGEGYPDPWIIGSILDILQPDDRNG